jgi:hypothetical protein
VVFAVIISLYLPASSSVKLVGERAKGREEQTEIVAGRWLAENYDADSSIIYDSYLYIPGKFSDAARSFGITYLAIEHFRPSLLVVRDAIVSDYSDTSRASDSRIGKVAFLDSHYFYKYLQEGSIPGYRLAKDFGSVAIFESEGIASRDAPWPDLVKMFGTGRLWVSRRQDAGWR